MNVPSHCPDRPLDCVTPCEAPIPGAQSIRGIPMKHNAFRFTRVALAAALAAAMSSAQADAVTDWNVKSGEVIAEAKLGTPPAVRVMALVQTAAYEAARGAGRDASVEAAIAAAHRF